MPAFPAIHFEISAIRDVNIGMWVVMTLICFCFADHNQTRIMLADVDCYLKPVVLVQIVAFLSKHNDTSEYHYSVIVLRGR